MLVGWLVLYHAFHARAPFSFRLRAYSRACSNGRDFLPKVLPVPSQSPQLCHSLYFLTGWLGMFGGRLFVLAHTFHSLTPLSLKLRAYVRACSKGKHSLLQGLIPVTFVQHPWGIIWGPRALTCAGVRGQVIPIAPTNRVRP